ncbi:hypothetical protein JB92DRAFT_2922000 [Gautieria morchelliformis]|nr:hypothetical protein JB92DRAFT_2922000 [Gautieria morchelliformis]
MPSYVVTGASRGIGLEFVRQLSEHPENVVFALVRDAAAARAVPLSPLKSAGPNVHILEADVTDHKALKTAAGKVAELTGGKLDVLINNAAVLNGENDWRTLLDFEGEEQLLEEEFEHTFKVNVMGVIHSINNFLPLLRNGNTRKVVTISSRGGDPDLVLKTGLSQMVAYGASKAAVNMIVVKFAIKLQTEGFIVFAVSPGLVDTSATAAAKGSAKNSEWIAKFEDNMINMNPNYQGMMTPDVSVKKQLEIIAGSTLKETGGFLSV